MNTGEFSTSCRKGLVLAAVGIIPITSWGSTPWLMGVFTLLITAAFLIEFGTNISTRTFPFADSELWVPFGILFTLSLYHLIRSPVPYSSLLFLSQFTVSLVFFHFIISGKTRIPARIFVFIWVGVMVPWVLFEAFVRGVRAPGGPFLNPNYLCTVILSCLAFLAGSLVDANKMKKAEWFCVLSAAMCTASLLLIGSRSAALGILLIFGFLMFRKRGWIRWAAAIVILVVLFGPSTVHHRVTEEYREDPHAFSRINIWQAALKMGADHPAIGVGPNLFYEHSPVYAFPMDELPVRYGRIVRKPHNEYLRSWAEGGLVGIAAAGLFVFFTLRLVVGSLRMGNTGPPLAMCAILFQALFHDITEVFALMALGAWWLGHLHPQAEQDVKGANRKVFYLGIVTALLLAGSSIWLNLELASRTFWETGQRMVGTDTYRAEKSFKRALLFNPFFPGARRDLALLHFGRFRELGTGPSFEKAADSTFRAWKINRLDTVPLRLKAALYVELARRSHDVQKEALEMAVEALDRARELEPHNALILVSLADVYWKLGQQRWALDLIEQALNKEPNYLAAHRKKISYLLEMDPGKVREAEMALEKAAQRAADYKPYSQYEEIILR